MGSSLMMMVVYLICLCGSRSKYKKRVTLKSLFSAKKIDRDPNDDVLFLWLTDKPGSVRFSFEARWAWLTETEHLIVSVSTLLPYSFSRKKEEVKKKMMIGWEDVYKVFEAMVPLYFALILGYGSVKWLGVFTPEQCEAINRFVCYFTLPLFTFEFTTHVDPFHMNYLFIGADFVSKVIIVLVLAFWAMFCSKGSYCWCITSFSLSTLTNSLVVGVPLIKAMYGQMGVDLVVQSSVIQAIVWLTVLLFVLEFRRSGSTGEVNDSTGTIPMEPEKDLEQNKVSVVNVRPSFWHLMGHVWFKLAMNPNSYACFVGVAWALVASRWHFEMPSIIEGSVLILSKAGTGTAMFSMGLFMGMQKKVISCGPSLTLYGMVMRFIVGPAAMAIGSVAVGLHGDVLRVAIIQAAIPQSITSFIYAKEYCLHADVLSTAVIFGMLVSLPVLIGYFAVLGFLH